MGGLLGLGGGAGGTGFSTQAGTDAGQMKAAYDDTQRAMYNQRALLEGLQGQKGLQKQTDVYGQLQNVVSGQGPNPAQAMLNQATGANVANQAALMAGQRGASQNAGLLARQAAQTGAGLQQQAVGQGATMQAQQALNAMGQAGSLATNMAQNQMAQTNQNVAAQQNQQNILQGANTANNQTQAALAGQQMKGQQQLIGGLMNAAGAGMGMADGGVVNPQGPQSLFGRSLMMPQMASGGVVPAMVSPEEIVLTPEEARMVAEGRARATEVGDKVPGKAPVKGDSYKNDIVPAKLPAGGVVVPKSKLETKNPDGNSAKFVRDVLAKKRVKK